MSAAAAANRPARAPNASVTLTDETARNQQRPTLDIDRANEDSQQRHREHEPSGRCAERRPRHAGDEERGDARLRDRERRRLSNRQERQQRR